MRSSDTDFFQYYPVSERDRSWGIFVTGVGSTLVPPYSAHYPLSRHPDVYMFTWNRGRTLREYQALYIYRGHGEFESATVGKVEVESGSLMLLFPGEWHRYRPHREIGWEEYWVSFNGPIVDHHVEEGFFAKENPVMKIGPEEVVLRAYRELRESASEQWLGSRQLQAANVHVILAAATAAIGRKRSTERGIELIRQAKAILEENVEGVVSMAKIAKSLHICEKHFRRLFKEHTSMSPYQYYLELKMHRARLMLNDSKFTVKQISRTLGFESPFHFSVAFKRKIGMPPSQWRKGAEERKFLV